ncbi:MAG: PH domain-containing protein [Candidatus Diapherotrites archaeon]|nr:PH domain-containing protein [Candidatus Diapherotrites archaeon]
MADEKKATVEIYPLEKRKILKKTVKIMFLVAILYIVCLAFLSLIAPMMPSRGLIQQGESPVSEPFFPGFVLLFFASYFVLFAIVYFYEVAYFKSYYYDIRQDFLVIKKGVFMPRETTLPYDKFQDVYMDQDIWDRIFSLWDLHVSTATFMSGWEAHIDGVTVQNGETMKKMILEKINESKKK